MLMAAIAIACMYSLPDIGLHCDNNKLSRDELADKIRDVLRLTVAGINHAHDVWFDKYPDIDPREYLRDCNQEQTDVDSNDRRDGADEDIL